MTSLLGELADATGRISHLVEDVKSYSQLDRADAAVGSTCTAGIDSTLTMLAPKLDGIEVVRELRRATFPRSRCTPPSSTRCGRT